MNVLRTCALIALVLFLGGCCAPDGGGFREASRARRELLRDMRQAQIDFRSDLRRARDDFRRRANEARMELRRSLRRRHEYLSDFQ
jgi:hypothetical protein